MPLPYESTERQMFSGRVKTLPYSLFAQKKKRQEILPLF